MFERLTFHDDTVRYNNKILNIPIASFQIETFEVIGNVWQNPELLEGVN